MYEVVLINDMKEMVVNAVSSNINAPRITGSIKKGINTIDSFTFSILPNNPGHNKIYPLKTLINIINKKTNKTVFFGRVLNSRTSMNDKGLISKIVVCESELGYLCDSTQVHGEYHNITVKDFLKKMIDNHNSQISVDKRFEVGTVSVKDFNDSLYRYLGYEETFSTIKDKLIDRLGGELQIRYKNGIRYLDYLERIGSTKGTEIRLSYNLKTIEEEQDPTTIITRLIPLGKKIENGSNEENQESEERLTIESVNSGLIYIDDLEAQEKFGIIAKSNTWDDVGEATNLLRKGKEFLKENNKIKRKYSINALDLSLIGLSVDSFKVGDSYRVKNDIMGIDDILRVIEASISIDKPYESTISVGDKFDDIKTYQNNMAKSQKKLENIRLKLNNTDIKLNEATNKIEEAYKQIEDIKYNSNNNYMFDIRNKTLESYKSDLALSDVTVMQSFDLDLANNVGYFAQLKKGTKGDIILTKLDLNNGSIVGKMTLENFGHAVSIVCEEAGLDTYIWIECVPMANSKGELFGTQIGRLKFEDGVTLRDNPSQVFDLLPGHAYTYPAIDKNNNLLAIKSISNKVHYYSIFDLESVLNSDEDSEPIMLHQFKVPNGVNSLSFQGFEVYKDYIYNYEGVARQTVEEENEEGAIVEAVRQESTAYVTVLNMKGFVQYREKVRGFDDLTYREAEGIKIKQIDGNTYNMYLGMASGLTGSRKANILKYTENIQSR